MATPNQGPLPAPKQQKESPLVKARVRPNNRYAGKTGGEIIEVEAAELKRVPHALISLEEEARQKEEAAKPKPAENSMFRSLRKSAQRAAEAQKESAAIQMRRQMEAYGIKVPA